MMEYWNEVSDIEAFHYCRRATAYATLKSVYGVFFVVVRGKTDRWIMA
jgi:hypothetical protein